MQDDIDELARLAVPDLRLLIAAVETLAEDDDLVGAVAVRVGDRQQVRWRVLAIEPV
jgi:hypothetical protein